MRIPIFVYHAMRIGGVDYPTNDLVAFGSDLESLHARGFEVLPVRELVRMLLDGRLDHESRGLAGLTCDDGCDFDFEDIEHPVAGMQRSILNRMRDFRATHPDAQVHVSDFVIVSPEAREELDKSCMIGRGWWNDTWWKSAVETGLMDIANHSWDHNHDALPARFFRNGERRGTFSGIDSKSRADQQIRVATDYLCRNAPNPGTRLFAYPYGESNDYLTKEYFPRHAQDMKIDAAFGDDPQYLDAGSNRWRLPRFVCGRDWKSETEFEAILDGAL